MQLFAQLALLACIIALAVAADIITPKVMIVSMFAPEAQAWYDNFHQSGLGNLSAIAVPARGLSMLFPNVFCTQDGGVCQVTVGEGEVNAAASTMALLLYGAFDLRNTYFLLGGIAGVNPKQATLGSIAFARFAVQVGLQYEVDPRSLPEDWDTGYVSYGSDIPHQYPTIIYGSEVFELNVNLRDVAYDLASGAKLEDSEEARVLRTRYDAEKPAAHAPGLVKCDVTTSDVYFVGDKLAQTFEKTTKVWTNDTGEYCMSAQEDNAVLEALIRGAADNLVDFSRVILMRTGANFDRPPPEMSIRDFMAEAATQPGQHIAAQNIYRAGIPIVRGISEGWDTRFAAGVAADNYVGDILGSLGGTPTPDFGSPATRLDAQPRVRTVVPPPTRVDTGSDGVDRRQDSASETKPSPTPRQDRPRRQTWQQRRTVATEASTRL